MKRKNLLRLKKQLRREQKCFELGTKRGKLTKNITHYRWGNVEFIKRQIECINTTLIRRIRRNSIKYKIVDGNIEIVRSI